MLAMIINENKALNGLEVSFESKPKREVLDTLKSNGFRWHNQKKIWYAKDNEKRRQALSSLQGEDLATKKAEPKKAKAVENKYGVKVGDIFLLSFGYSMVLYDFFQVVSVTESTCRVIEIAVPCVGGGGYTPRFQAELGKTYEAKERSQWVKDQVKGDLKRIGGSKENPYISFDNGYYHARPYDGREVEEDHWD